MTQAINRALSEQRSNDPKTAQFAGAQLRALQIFAFGFLEAKGLMPLATFMDAFQQFSPRNGNADEFANYLSRLAQNPTETRNPALIAAAAFAAGVLWEHYAHHGGH